MSLWGASTLYQKYLRPPIVIRWVSYGGQTKQSENGKNDKFALSAKKGTFSYLLYVRGMQVPVLLSQFSNSNVLLQAHAENQTNM